MLIPVRSDCATCICPLSKQLGHKADRGEIVVKVQLMIPSFDGVG